MTPRERVRLQFTDTSTGLGREVLEVMTNWPEHRHNYAEDGPREGCCLPDVCLDCGHPVDDHDRRAEDGSCNRCNVIEGPCMYRPGGIR